jgi:rare lipoprotein A
MNISNQVKRTVQLLGAGILICFCFARPTQTALASSGLPDLDPEIIANSWQEEDGSYASVTVNGREIIKFRESATNPNAGERAEEIAARLDELVKDNKFDPERLFPAKEGELATIKLDGATVMRFPVADLVVEEQSQTPTALEHSWRVVNTIRTALGVTLLPQSFLKLSEFALHDAASLAKAAGHFSGAASWYGGKFNGRKCSDGTVYDDQLMTAAHRSLPFGTKLLVLNRKTGDSCVVKVNDRGPFVDGRVIDLSKAAAKKLNMIGSGVATVDCLVLDQ